MRLLMLVFTLAFGLGVVAASPGAEAGSRITCQCKTRTQTWIMGRYACEHHYNKPFRTGLVGGSKPVRNCTVRENQAFRGKLCAEECTKK